MNNKTAAIGALLCAASVALGAFGAHLIADSVSADRLATWQTAARYLGTQGLGILLLSLSSRADMAASGKAHYCRHCNFLHCTNPNCFD